MKTADFLGTQPFLNHLQRRRMPRRVLMLCLFCAICLGGSVAFEVSVHVEEKRAEAGQRPMPEAAQAQAELGEIYGEMNAFSQALDPLAEHLARPTAAGTLAGMDEALGPEVEVERVAWSREIKADKKGKKKANGPEILVLIVEAIATNEETATSLDAILSAYTGMKAQIQDHEPVADRWPAVRMTVRLESEIHSLPEVEAKS
jgi:hypothetical protein